jgi:LysR family transcriptional regulator, hydrogen peroxide-inducible genes activator
MNLSDLRYALAVQRLRSFSRAAEDCGVAQPTLSTQIRKLEDELGVLLFERDGRAIRVTTAGEPILEQARAALDAVRLITELAQTHADPMVGPIRLGVIPTLGPYLLPRVLPCLHELLPRASLIVVEDTTQVLIQALVSGNLDAAIVATDHRDANLSEILLFDEPFSFAVPQGDPLATRTRIVPDDIDPATLILLAEGHCLSDQAIALCGDRRTQGMRGSDLRATSLETVLNLVEAQLGTTIVPALARAHMEAHFSRICYRPLICTGASRRVRIVHRPFVPRTPAIRKIAQGVESCLPTDLVSRCP